VTSGPKSPQNGRAGDPVAERTPPGIEQDARDVGNNDQADSDEAGREDRRRTVTFFLKARPFAGNV
jgi:hypothetical protein